MSDQTPTPGLIDEVPVHKQPLKELVKAFPKRIIGLANKLFSFKFAILALATVMWRINPEAFPWYAWTIVFLLVMLGRDGAKLIKDLKK